MTISNTKQGEHGIGIGKKGSLVKELGLDTIGVMLKVKSALDPNSLMNPVSTLYQFWKGKVRMIDALLGQDFRYTRPSTDQVHEIESAMTALSGHFFRALLVTNVLPKHAIGQI